MAFTPNSTVYLLDTPLDNTYKNTLHFESKTEQYNYFLSCLKHSFEGVTYQRKDNSIRVNKNIDALWNSNYVMYQNENFSSKWFYAFITKMEYVSANVTDIFIETDVYQTWLFDTKLKKSFVVREHVKDDTIGSNLVDEQLETGEYIMKAYIPSNKLGANWNILAVSDTTPLGGTAEVGNIYGNVVTGLAYFPFPNTDLGVQWLRTVIDLYTTAGKSDAIVMIFTIPEMLLDSIPESWSIGQPIPSNTLPAVKVAVLDKVKSNLDGYVPKNNKMFTFPYNFLYVSNNSGLSATYRYEYFPTDTANFSIFGVISPSPKLMLAPMDYKGEGLKYEYGLTLQGFPMCSWTTDSYTAWLA
jgi:hypothetical protein